MTRGGSVAEDVQDRPWSTAALGEVYSKNVQETHFVGREDDRFNYRPLDRFGENML